MTTPDETYELLDSGGEAKLERFGPRLLVRPSTLAVWSRRRPDLWRRADATHVHSRGWTGPMDRSTGWTCSPLPGIRMHLRLQDNGQTGLFPEHASYLPECAEWLSAAARDGKKPRVLNLFAYTGLASLVCARAGAEVTHVDLAKPCLDWTADNLRLNGLDGVRFLRDDALKVLERQARQGQKYDLVIADPPTFSRPARNQAWALDEVLADLVQKLARVVATPGRILLTSHLQQSSPQITANLFRDLLPAARVTVRELFLPETGTGRILPCGHCNLVDTGALQPARES